MSPIGHETDIPNGPGEVCCWGINGQDADLPLLLKMTPNGHPTFAGAVVDFPPFITRRPVAKW
jgi:hypothetical protein